MISVQEVVVDPDMTAPRPYLIQRSTGHFVPGGFESFITEIPMFGPVQQANNKEVQMLAENDRIGSIRSFWCTQPVFVTQGYASVPGTHGEVPTGSGTHYTLSEAPAENLAQVYSAGLLLQPVTDYVINGTALVFINAPASPLYITWPITVNAGTNASDIIQYDNERYRILQVYFDPGGGYHKALGTRLAAA